MFEDIVHGLVFAKSICSGSVCKICGLILIVSTTFCKYYFL